MRKHIFFSIMISIVLTLSITGRAQAGEWKQDGKGWWYQKSDKGYLKDTWFIDKDGKQYYFNSDGYMLQDTMTPDGFFVGADGAFFELGERGHGIRLAYEHEGYLEHDVDLDGKMDKVWLVRGGFQGDTWTILPDEFLDLNNYKISCYSFQPLDKPKIINRGEVDFVADTYDENQREFEVRMNLWYQDILEPTPDGHARKTSEPEFGKKYLFNETNIILVDNPNISSYKELWDSMWSGEHPMYKTTLNCFMIECEHEITGEKQTWYFWLIPLNKSSK